MRARDVSRPRQPVTRRPVVPAEAPETGGTKKTGTGDPDRPDQRTADLGGTDHSGTDQGCTDQGCTDQRRGGSSPVDS
ncbi:hypothetical protein [Kribbella sp. NPDC048915]|uniref:hypothetical protein n=1 Tax=Kribbella sp. NPDC048915 TaxID=3155148 RepID=UPI0033E002B5